MKYLSNKEQVFEFFNPVLDGSSISGPTGPQTDNCSGEMLDVPTWLNPDISSDDTQVMQGDRTSIGTFYLNGVPLSSWSAQKGGSLTGYHRKHTFQNWYYINALTSHLFPNGIQAFINKTASIDIEVENLTIVKMIPLNIGIGFDIHVRFNIGENEIWGKFGKVGIERKPVFTCQEIEQLPIEQKIKITGKIWNTILAWFKPKGGIYKCKMKDVLVYTELGQLKSIKEDNIIEVIFSDEDKIKLKFDNINYIIKKPTFYWFNWYFEKI